MIKNIVILVTTGTSAFLLGRVIADKAVENELKRKIEVLELYNASLKDVIKSEKRFYETLLNYYCNKDN